MGCYQQSWSSKLEKKHGDALTVSKGPQHVPMLLTFTEIQFYSIKDSEWNFVYWHHEQHDQMSWDSLNDG